MLKRKSLLALLLVVLMLSSQIAFAADSNVNPAGVFPIVKEPITLTIFMIQPANVSDLKDNDATRLVEEKTGINLEFISVPSDGFTEKLNIMINSGDYPDIISVGEGLSVSNENLMVYGSQGIFLPLNDLIDEYGYYIKDIFEKEPTFRSDMTALDGNIYGLPVYENAYHCLWPQKLWINQNWLDTLGLEMPTTTDEFYNVMKAFKEQDPNGNGIADEIPLTGAIQWQNGQPQHHLMNAFIYCDRRNYFFVDEDSTLQYAPLQDEWREGLRFMNKLYADGLLDPGAFTQKMEQVKALGTNPDAELLGAVTTLHPGHFTALADDNDRHTHYTAMPPLTGPEGVRYATYFAGYSGGGWIITDACEHPEAAFRLADFFYGEEGTLMITEGLEGKTWRYATEDEKNVNGDPATYYRINYTHVTGESHNYNWGNEMFRNRGNEATGLRGKFAYSQDIYTVDGYETRLFRETRDKYDGTQPAEVFTSVFLPAEQTEDAAHMKVNIEEYVNQSMVRFITGDLSLDEDWDSYLQQMKDLGVEDYLAIYADAYAAKIAK